MLESIMSAKDVLVIDDDPELADAIAAILEFAGFEVRCAASGKKGLALAREKRPGIILLDWQMPNQMGGQEVLVALAEDPLLRSIPLILMSAHVEAIPAENLKTYLHLSKPFDGDSMVQLVTLGLQSQQK
jgi:CheY-like chemotaxis protein